MDVTLDPAWLIGFLLAFVRAAAWMVVTPPFSARGSIPPMAKIAIAGGLAVMAAPHLATSALPDGSVALVAAVVLQVVVGVALGFSVQILMSAFSSAGALIDMFGGIYLPPSEDPISGQQTPLLGQFYEQVAVLLLFVSNGELLLVHGFEQSFGAPGLTLASTGRLASVLGGDLATFFVAAVEIAAPIIAVLFTAQVALAVLAKAAPQVNVWFLGFPLQVMISLVLVVLGIRVLPPYLDHVVGRALQDFSSLLSGG